MKWIQLNGTPAPQEMVDAACAAAAEFAVPAGILLGTIERESNFRTGLVSSAGAVGPCQFKRKFEKDYHRYAGFAFDLEGLASIRGMAAVFRTYAGWARMRHGFCGEDVWRCALLSHRYGQNSAEAKQLQHEGRVSDVEACMRRNGVWYDTPVSADAAAAKAAAEWAKGKVGCRYSRSRRQEEGYFDCSSLIARAYAAQGVDWAYVGSAVPTSSQEVYSDRFELLWPASYDRIGKTFADADVLRRAAQAGDVQYLCTDKKTHRKNRITHAAMVISGTTIVHARSEKHGVRQDDIELYKGKVCAVCRYAPETPLRIDMRGTRVAALQQRLNVRGAALIVDGVYGAKTAAAALKFEEGE